MTERKYTDRLICGCPKCDAICEADAVDNGVGMQQCGPYVCEQCGWVEKQEHPELLPLADDELPF